MARHLVIGPSHGKAFAQVVAAEPDAFGDVQTQADGSDVFVCTLHGWRFDCETGACITSPTETPLRIRRACAPAGGTRHLRADAQPSESRISSTSVRTAVVRLRLLTRTTNEISGSWPAPCGTSHVAHSPVRPRSLMTATPNPASTALRTAEELSDSNAA